MCIYFGLMENAGWILKVCHLSPNEFCGGCVGDRRLRGWRPPMFDVAHSGNLTSSSRMEIETFMVGVNDAVPKIAAAKTWTHRNRKPRSQDPFEMIIKSKIFRFLMWIKAHSPRFTSNAKSTTRCCQQFKIICTIRLSAKYYICIKSISKNDPFAIGYCLFNWR